MVDEPGVLGARQVLLLHHRQHDQRRNVPAPAALRVPALILRHVVPRAQVSAQDAVFKQVHALSVEDPLEQHEGAQPGGQFEGTQSVGILEKEQALLLSLREALQQEVVHGDVVVLQGGFEGGGPDQAVDDGVGAQVLHEQVGRPLQKQRHGAGRCKDGGQHQGTLVGAGQSRQLLVRLGVVRLAVVHEASVHEHPPVLAGTGSVVQHLPDEVGVVTRQCVVPKLKVSDRHLIALPLPPQAGAHALQPVGDVTVAGAICDAVFSYFRFKGLCPYPWFRYLIGTVAMCAVVFSEFHRRSPFSQFSVHDAITFVICAPVFSNFRWRNVCLFSDTAALMAVHVNHDDMGVVGFLPHLEYI